MHAHTLPVAATMLNELKAKYVTFLVSFMLLLISFPNPFKGQDHKLRGSYACTLGVYYHAE